MNERGGQGRLPMVAFATAASLSWSFVRSGSVGQDSLEHRLSCRGADGWRRGMLIRRFRFGTSHGHSASPDAVAVDRHGVSPPRESAFISVDQRFVWRFGRMPGRDCPPGHGFLLLLSGCRVVQSMHGGPSASLGVGGAAGQQVERSLARPR